MSRENVEIARLVYERYNRGDIKGLLDLCEPDFEFRDVPDIPGSGVYIGHDGYRRWHRGMLDAFEDLRFEGVEFIDAGDQVVVAARGVARGKAVGPASRWITPTSSRSKTAGSSASPATARTAKPSKPWGSGSNRFL